MMQLTLQNVAMKIVTLIFNFFKKKSTYDATNPHESKITWDRQLSYSSDSNRDSHITRHGPKPASASRSRLFEGQGFGFGFLDF